MATVSRVASSTEPSAGAPGASVSSRAGRHTLLPFGTAAALLVAWQVLAWAFALPIYIAPTPAQIARTLVTELPTLLRNFVPTAAESFVGFLLGNTVAILISVLFVHSKRLEAAFYPIAVFINTIPILAKAPILVLIFGLGMTSKVVIAAFICFFPTLANMVRGLGVGGDRLRGRQLRGAGDRELAAGGGGWLGPPATIAEVARATPVVDATDVLVVGGGPAGVSAAVAAARSGARVTLVGRYPYLGGLASGGMVLVLDDMVNGAEITTTGLVGELIERLEKLGLAVSPPPEDRRVGWDAWRRWARWGCNDFRARGQPQPIGC